ncbi:AIG2-like protein [Aspergillus crustosus]
MGDHVLFFYGTLMAPQILHRVIHGSPTPQKWQADLLRFRPAILHGFQRHRVRGADYPGIISTELSFSSSLSVQNGSRPGAETAAGTGPSLNQEHATANANAKVLGTVVSGLTDGDLHRLDIFEGSEYTRERVQVRILTEALSGDGEGDGDSDGQGGDGSGENSDRHLKDVLEAAGAEFADEGEEVEAETYVWVAGRKRLENAEWDFEAFKRDKMAWWVTADERDW